MLPSSSSDHVILLRSAIARIEAAGAGGARTGAPRGEVRLGERVALDKALGRGLAGGGLNEILPAGAGDMAAACGFALALAALLAGVKKAGAKTLIWIVEDFAAAEYGMPYGPGLAWYGLMPQNLVLVRAPRGQDALWALEAALKTCGVVVIGQLSAQHRLYDLAASRRLSMAARASGSPGLILHGRARQPPASAAGLRLEIASHASEREPSAAQRLPIPGPPCWSVRIAKARAGPGQAVQHDPERRYLMAWNPIKGCFCDALPVPPPAKPAYRPHYAAHAGSRQAQTA